MSRKVGIGSWQRELYTLSYSWIRCFHNDAIPNQVAPISVGTEERQRIFGRALISHQNRGYSGYCWHNLGAMAHFRARARYQPEWYGIPF